MTRTIHDHPNGRPRKYNLDDEAEKLNTWSKLDDSLYLQDFTDDKDYSTTALADFAKSNENFKEALIKAKDRITARMKKGVNANSFNYGIWHRYAAVNDHLLNAHDKDLVEHKIDYEYNKKMQLTQALVTPPNDAIIALKHENEDQQALILQLKRTIDDFKRQAVDEHSRGDAKT